MVLGVELDTVRNVALVAIVVIVVLAAPRRDGGEGHRVEARADRRAGDRGRGPLDEPAEPHGLRVEGGERRHVERPTSDLPLPVFDVDVA